MGEFDAASAEKTISDLIPKSLDNIIRARRDKYALRLTMFADFEGLPHLVEAMGGIQRNVKGELTAWQIICFEDIKKQSEDRLFLIGYKNGGVFMTSPVKSVDFKNGMLLTENSLYRLIGAEARGEPDTDLLIHICTTFNAWGVGQHLGVPQFFY